ncbi:Muscarinic acetylcholine receptor DM1 [Aphelenchoides fujianensis]|nr:Muscarinic acetylcholine receptor DM1 [Aphelenchoides fujianensis]
MNGKFSTASHAQRNDEQRKSEKERRKNERRQESKGRQDALGHPLLSFGKHFFPNSIPDILFTISYCLCYINSTTYTRILRCRWNERRNDSLYRHAYLRRT